MSLTKEQQDRYKENGHGLCPNCNSDNLESETSDVSECVAIYITCNDCNSNWYDVYKFSGIEDFRLGVKN